MSEEKKSENPFKYGDVLVNDKPTKYKVLGVCGDVVHYTKIIKNLPESVFSPTEIYTYHYIYIVNTYNVKTVLKKNWVNLNDDENSPHYWKKWRDKAVWVRDSIKGNITIEIRMVYAIWTPLLPLYIASNASTWKQCSVYNDDGVKAEFKDEFKDE